MTREEFKKWAIVHQNELYIAGIAIGVIGSSYIIGRASKVVDTPIEDIPKIETISFDELKDLDIKKSFAVVEYENGEVGVIKDVIKVAVKMLRQDSSYYRFTNILIDDLPDDKVSVVTGVATLMEKAGLNVTLM